MYDMFVIPAVFQLVMFPLNAVAPSNICCMLPDMPVVVQDDRSWLKDVAAANIPWKLLTLETFQLANELLKAVALVNICCIETALVVLIDHVVKL